MLVQIFSGDFYQLPPVRADTLYSTNTRMKSTAAVTGRDLWMKTLNSVVLLRENFRARKDPVWQGILKRLRLNQLKAEDIAELKKRMLQTNTHTCNSAVDPDAPTAKVDIVIAPGATCDSMADADIHSPTEELVIVPDNVCMEKINHQFTSMNAHMIHRNMKEETFWRKRGALWIDAKITSTKSLSGRRKGPYRDLPVNLPRQLRKYVTQKDLDKKKAMTLRVLLGHARYMVTVNSNLSHGIANGMQASIVDIRLKDGVQPQWDPINKVHRVLATHVDCLVLRYHNEDWAKKELHKSLPAGHFLLGLAHPRNHIVKINYLQRKIRVTQFPIIQAHAVTGHKAQGMTVAKMVVSNLWNEDALAKRKTLRISSWAAWFYVALSRCSTLGGITLSDNELPLPPRSKYLVKQRMDVHYEMARLNVIAVITEARVNGTSDSTAALLKISRAQKSAQNAFEEAFVF